MRSKSGSVTGSRLRKKHKRLDAICENVYNRNHNESSEATGGSSVSGSGSCQDAGLDLRRSSRVRRAPDVLDASPPPVKRRKKTGNSVNLSIKRSGRISLESIKEDEEVESEEVEGLDSLGGWRSRLRARGKKVGIRDRGETSGAGRRKLFDEVEVVESELFEKKGEVVRLKRPGRVKVGNDVGGGQEEGSSRKHVVNVKDTGDMCVVKDESDKMGYEGVEKESEGAAEKESGEGLGKESGEGLGKESGEGVGKESGEAMPVLGSQMGGGNEGEEVNGDSDDVYLGSDEAVEEEILDGMELETRVGRDEDVGNLEKSGEEVEELESGKDAEKEMGGVEVDSVLSHKLKDGQCHDREEGGLEHVEKMPLEGEEDVVVSKSKLESTDTLCRRIKQGRRCGLCGCGNDGKPPKMRVQDAGESENEAYSGSSASEEPNYDIWDGFGDEPGWLGRLLGPINDRYGIAGIWVHQHCAVWSPEVYFAGLGCLKNVRAALCRGRALKCTRCGRPGATIGCRVDRCPKTYHLPCARANGCIFDHRKFLIACTDHRHLFQPHGHKYLMRIKKLKAKKMKLEMRKLSNDALRKDVEAEERWLENCGEDEEFLKRESKRLHRDLLRIAPVYIGGPDSESGKLFEGWESVAGLQDVIQCMKEVVILPLLYPEFFTNLGITPPRGILLHGYPGTGKTLVVRALIGSCARGDKRIAYFARKGADCLGKYVGDAERQLRLLFQVAERSQPSIIFFDEIDGLAPTRTRQQDQTHSSVVSTLLALMDGLKSRGSVVVIGATNRPEAVDPALRRPGRFDREIYFPLPSLEDRAAILSLHTKRWPKPVTGPLLKWVARKTVGFAGADLQALCTQAAIIALKRNFPLQEMLSAAEEKTSGAKRHPLPAFEVEERDWLEALSCAPPPCSRREAGIAAYELLSSPLPTHLIPCLLRPLITLVVSLYLDERLWLPPLLAKAAVEIKSVFVSSLEKNNLPTDRWWSHIDSSFQEEGVTKEIRRRLSFAGILSEEARCGDMGTYTDETDDNCVNIGPSVVHNASKHSNKFRSMSFAPRKKSGFQVLIAGNPRCGQKHLGSCILHCFVGNVEIQKVDLATISQGHDDVEQGISQILMKCASLQSCMIFMPRIDLWAAEACHQVVEENDESATDHQPSPEIDFHNQVVEKQTESSEHQSKAAKGAESEGATKSASYAWRSFVEQVESIRVSTSLMILATSEIPYAELPQQIIEFFRSDVSNSGLSTPMELTVPRFTVNVDENLNRDVVISLSAAKLAGDIIEAFVQLIHQKAHIRTSPFERYKVSNSIRDSSGSNYLGENLGSVRENGVRAESLNNSSQRVPSPALLPNNKVLKGKSGLLFAISTFGYQILWYPHFAELCWVTSKLKEGPCADVSGHWKGWPFNSCIIRPGNSTDKVGVANSGSAKCKERSGLVRGLIAVGLLAYRGVYESVREVSFEVRRVLELLVGQVNEKVKAGKDRYQYVRLLSQVAYLEDMVNSWAYALQSLEVDTQVKVANSKLIVMESPDDHSVMGQAVLSQECKDASNNNIQKSEQLVGIPQGLSPENMEDVELRGGDSTIYPNSNGRAAFSEDRSMQQTVDDFTDVDKHLQGSTSGMELVGNIRNKENGTTLGWCEPENNENHAVAVGNSESFKRINGFMSAEPVVCIENGHCNLVEGQEISEVETVECRGRSADGEPDLSKHVQDTGFCSSETISQPTNSGLLCFYNCCSGCLIALHNMLQNILTREWDLNETCWRPEDVHDLVESLFMDLLSAIRKVDNSKNTGKLLGEIVENGLPERSSECPESCNRQLKSSGNSIDLLIECTCHSVDGCVTGKPINSSNSQLGLNPKFVFRDGILVPVDSDKDVSFHCKYETLCLCSVVESIRMIKQPL